MPYRHPQREHSFCFLSKIQKCFAFCIFLCSLIVLPFPVSAADPLTKEERAWLLNHGPLKVSFHPEYQPFEFVDPQGQPAGMSIELFRWIANTLNFHITFIPKNFAQSQQALLDGEIDATTLLFYNEKRELEFDFTTKTWDIPTSLFVRADRDDLNRVTDMEGLRIAIPRGDYGISFLAEHNLRYSLIPTQSFAEAVEKVLTRQADALVGDQPTILHNLYSQGLTGQLKIIGGQLYCGHAGFALQNNQTILLSILNKGISLAREEGFFANVSLKWFPGSLTEETNGNKKPRNFLVAGFIIAFLLVIILFVWIVYLQKTIIQKTKEFNDSFNIESTIKPFRPWKKLFARFSFLLIILIILTVFGNFILVNYVVMPEYLNLENEFAEKKMLGIMNTFKNEARHIESLCLDWSQWDDSFLFMKGLQDTYIKSNLKIETLSNRSNIDLIIFINTDGTIFWQGLYEINTGKEIHNNSIQSIISLNMDFFKKQMYNKKTQSGVINTEKGPMIIAYSPVVPTANNMPTQGILVMGRFLRKNIINTLEEQQNMILVIPPSFHKEKHPINPKEQLYSNFSLGTYTLEKKSKNLLIGRGSIEDIYGNPSINFIAYFSRKLAQKGQAAASIVSFILFESVFFIFLGTTLWFGFSFRETANRQQHTEEIIKKRTEDLRQSERNFRALYESMTGIVFVTDKIGTILHTNGSTLDYLGCSSEETLNTNLQDWMVISPEERPFTRILGQLEDGNQHTFQHLLKTRFGQTFSVKSTLWIGHWAGQHCIFGMSSKLTPEEEARQALLSAFQVNPLPMTLNSLPYLQYAEVNEAFASIIGYTRKEILGQNPLSLNAIQDPTHYLWIQKKAQAGENFKNYPITIRHRNGSLRFGTLSGEMMLARGRRDLLTVFTDLTEHKKVEASLQQAKDHAEAANMAKSIFLANMSHEIRTPVSGVMGILQLLQKTQPSHEQKEYITSAINSCTRLVCLLTDILDLSRVEAGKISLQLRSMDIQEVLQQTKDLFLPTAREKNIDLTFSISSDIPKFIQGDAIRLQQIFTNIVGNAIKFTKNGFVHVKAEVLSSLDQHKIPLLFTIEDSGIGIPKDKISLLFKPFSQAETEYTRNHQGAGLGLSICKKLVDLMGGSLFVESEEGKGTLFSIGIVFDAEKEIHTSSPKIRKLTAHINGISILLAEDDMVTGMATQKLLEKSGATVRRVFNGQEVWNALQEEDFDLILMDVQMPETDGIQSTKEIRNGKCGKKLQNIPIIALTAYAMKGDKKRFLSSGFDDYASKPIDLEKLSAIIVTVLNNKK